MSESPEAVLLPESARIGVRPSRQLPFYACFARRRTVAVRTSDDGAHTQYCTQPCGICMFRKQWRKFITMRVKATCSLLAFLLVGIQAFASVCTVRCETMASTSSTHQMAGMADCQMASQAGSSHLEMAAFVSSQSCVGHPCISDWTFLQNQVVHELSLASLPMAFAGHPALPIPIASRLHLEANRSTRIVPPFDPLISNLRV